MKEAAGHVEKLGAPEVASRTTQWLRLFAAHAEEVAPGNQDVLRGLAWTASLLNERHVLRAVASVVTPALHKIPQTFVYDYGGGDLRTWSETRARAPRLANAAFWTLGRSSEGVTLLVQLKASIKERVPLRTIEKQLAEAAKRIGVAPEALETLAVPD